jgi:hypothetical protein
MNRSTLEATFDIGLKAWKVEPPQIEYRFHPSRKWRFDRAWQIGRASCRERVFFDV